MEMETTDSGRTVWPFLAKRERAFGGGQGDGDVILVMSPYRDRDFVKKAVNEWMRKPGHICHHVDLLSEVLNMQVLTFTIEPYDEEE